MHLLEWPSAKQSQGFTFLISIRTLIYYSLYRIEYLLVHIIKFEINRFLFLFHDEAMWYTLSGSKSTFRLINFESCFVYLWLYR
jgi:hypothetical protein